MAVSSTAVQQEAARPGAVVYDWRIVAVEAYDLAAIVDPVGLGSLGARDIDRGEPAALVPDERALLAGVDDVLAHDLAAIVDACGEELHAGLWSLDRGVAIPVQQKRSDGGGGGALCRNPGHRRHERRCNESCRRRLGVRDHESSCPLPKPC